VKVTAKGSLRATAGPAAGAACASSASRAHGCARAGRARASVRAGASERFTVTVTNLPRAGETVKLRLTLIGGRGQVIARRGVSLRGRRPSR